MNAEVFQFFAAPLRVGEERIASVDDDIAFFQEGGELIDDGVHWRAGFDHDHGLARLLERADEFPHRAGWLNVFILPASSREFLCDFGGAIKNGDRKSL